MKKWILAILRSFFLGQGYNLVRAPRKLVDHPEGDLVIDLQFVLARHLLDRDSPSDVFFIQVGAFDGVSGDPIHDFVKRFGWKGVLVEPQQKAYERLKETYKGFVGLELVNAAISTDSGTRKLFKILDSGEDSVEWAEQIASFDRASVERHATRENLGAIEVEEVQTISFAALTEKFGVEKIDLLQIDTEGFDFQVIKMVDFEHQAPDIIHYEHCHLGKRTAEESFAFLIERGYRLSVGEKDTIAMKSKEETPLRG